IENRPASAAAMMCLFMLDSSNLGLLTDGSLAVRPDGVIALNARSREALTSCARRTSFLTLLYGEVLSRFELMRSAPYRVDRMTA
ncbi:MAG TPA: hypothetical protein VN289_05965, partial [Paraburkholderia sp.]|nr:hypothetical protein [Paraburkholderia sp.]